MTTSMTLVARQHLTPSPRLQQAMNLLQLSSLEFEQALREAAASNPFLDQEEEREAPTPSLQGYAFERSPSSATAQDVMERLPEEPGLREQLRRQLCGSRCSEREHLAAELVIDTLDDDGYLREDVPVAVVQPGLTQQDIGQAIALVRSFEPAGVAAGSLTECLLLQLEAEPQPTAAHALARRILRQQMELLSRRDFRGLQQRLDCSEASLRAALRLIRQLDPSPARSGLPSAGDYVTPDVLVQEQDGRFEVVPNPALRPGACLNQDYVQMFRQGRRRGEYPGMAGQLREARWLLRNLQQRQDTILRVARCIVARQQGFFSAGEIGLQPLLAREVARELDCHESTVSRACSNKYMATPLGCFEFRHFFTRELSSPRARCSAGAVREMIRELIGAEAADAPLSDVDLAARLQEMGVPIARRTVTKYRQMLKLPPVEFRRSAQPLP
ncbi:RNA polymerase factor sigma-54 [Solimonas sp. SE-A11]|uniref:RNA polymerase factor sigma-54 n=1 Tax=Solimonas sp. SE-A11 TaxID=3054954 RepID=UPI00259CD238|nr:RNA polymerase factor sigma-54 [Solimonas sp. SE-A11]MDM4772730.1 RNA polymerase factor sigma-54 [Solimonas sp. SE-A11]